MTDDLLSDNPVLKSFSEEMRCGIFTNAAGDVMIVHDKETKAPVDWLEYNAIDNKISLIYENGTMQDLGIEISSQMQANLSNGIEVTLTHLADEQVQSVQTVSLVIQEY